MSLPPLPDSFYWTPESWGVALRCRKLDPIAQHLFTTRQLELRGPETWSRLGPSIGVSADRFVTVNQVHGNRIVAIEPHIEASKLRQLQDHRPDADGLASSEPDVALVVRAADCVPLLIADARSGAVAAVHAGWRGTVARVAVAAVETLTREFGTRPADLITAIGPAIGACCYEVGTNVVDAFAAAGHERYLIDRWFLAPPPPRGSTVRPGLMLDLARANRDQLVLAGLREESIHTAGLCTAMHLDLLASYRAEGAQAGRIVAVIKASATNLAGAKQ